MPIRLVTDSDGTRARRGDRIATPGIANWLDTAGHSNGAMILRCVRTEHSPVPTVRVVTFDEIVSALPAENATDHRRPNARRSSNARRRAVARKVQPMTFSVDDLEAGARAATGLHDFGSPYYREGFERTVDALNAEADSQRAGSSHPARDDQQRADPTLEDRGYLRSSTRRSTTRSIGGPVFVIGLPRTGTTALSQLVAADPQFRSLRMWESQACTPPPEAATEHTIRGSRRPTRASR